MKKFVLLTVALLLLTGCTKTAQVEQEDVTQEVTKSYSMVEVNKHNNKDDCWLAIDNKVYEVTEFVSGHPGGKALLEGCGKDATELFKTRPMGSKTPHSDRANKLLSKYLIGEIDE